MMKELGFTASEVKELMKFSDSQILAEIDTREEYGEFTNFTLLGYTPDKLRSFIEHRNELVAEYNLAEAHQAFVEDEKREFYDLDLYD